MSRIPLCRACRSRPEPFLAEYFCKICRAPFLNPFPLDEEGRCALCRLGLPGFDAAYSFGSYEGILREWIHLFKYGRIKTMEQPLAELLLAALPRDQQFDAIVPVPLHWRRRWQRGFNQSDLLARRLARRCGFPVIRALRRRRNTATQTGLSRTGRRHNVAAAFGVSRPQSVKGKRLLLVDDVMTTGATGAACARVLRRAGAARVIFLTVARADRRIRPALETQVAHGE